MDRHVLLGYGTLVVATLLTSWQVFSRERSIPAPAPASVEVARVGPRGAMPTVDAGPVEDPPAVPVDALTDYLAMRDDIDPKPRLRRIDDWAREVGPGDNLDLLTQAMVDADESVRARAGMLFEREVARR